MSDEDIVHRVARDAEPVFLQTFNDNSSATNIDCSGPEGCNLPPNNNNSQVTNHGGKRSVSDEDFTHRVARDAESAFKQEYSGSSASTFDCTQGGSKGGKISQTYNGDSSATNYDNTKNKRSPDSDPDFDQTYRSGSSADNYSGCRNNGSGSESEEVN